MKTKNISRIVLGTACILMIPLVAMQFSDEVQWNLSDFIIAGTLLLGSGLTYEFIASNIKNQNQRLALGIFFVAVVLLIWAELAVGVFGTPFAGS